MKRRLKIAVVAHTRYPIAEPFHGGMEAHSYSLASGLAERGHDVTLFASGDSDRRFNLFPIVARHYDQAFPWTRYYDDPKLDAILDEAFLRANKVIFSGYFDIVHNNSLHCTVPLEAKKTAQPTVTSLHIPPYDAIHKAIRNSLCATHVATVTSSAQNHVWWGEHVPSESIVVHNGIDLRAWPFEASGGSQALWCGRINPNKGPHYAIAAARKAGIALRLFGFKEHVSYFDELIAPQLDERITYGGIIRGSRLVQEMHAARALLFTPCWDEPFGLIAVEAMSCGLPVAAFDRGAAREIIGEKAGRYACAGDIDALSRALISACAIQKAQARAHVESHYSLERMLSHYESLYTYVTRNRRHADHIIKTRIETQPD